MKKIGILIIVICTLFLQACQKNMGNETEIKDISIEVRAYEWGATVPKIIIELNNDIDTVNKDDLIVQTNGIERKVQKSYLSDKEGHEVKGSSRYVTLELEVTYNPQDIVSNALPSDFDYEKFHVIWPQKYMVSLSGLEITQDKKDKLLSAEVNTIDNRLTPDSDLFTKRGKYDGNYTNPITGIEDVLTLNYAAYEPETIESGTKNPLVIWLHGQTEGGTDIDIDLLGNEVSSLAQPDIQEYFSSKDEIGSYVLAVQTPTYWMDEGDGTNGNGSGDSRYLKILMDTIESYVNSNPDIDTNRIYLMGASNGGFMTMDMIINYPDYFAAAVPIAQAYSYYEYEREEDGTYKVDIDKETGMRTFYKTNNIWFTDEKAKVLQDFPIWFVQSIDDTTVPATDYVLPIYKKLVQNGNQNQWLSLYESVNSTEIPELQHLGHLSWIYVFNNQVQGVQDRQSILSNENLDGYQPDNDGLGGSKHATFEDETYENLFEWLNAQNRK
ncbi:TPA: prolyl oligopeptidase family serine peptidase [Streptococcus suis]